MRNTIVILFTMIFFISSNAYAASSVAEMVRNYQISVRVHNVPAEEAIKAFTQDVIDQQITQAELLSYLQAQLPAEDYQQIKEIVDGNANELATLNEVDPFALETLLQETILAAQFNTGANYAGCIAGFATLGVATIAGSILLVVYGGDASHYNPLVGEEMNNAASISGVILAVGLTLALGSSAFCRRIYQ